MSRDRRPPLALFANGKIVIIMNLCVDNVVRTQAKDRHDIINKQINIHTLKTVASRQAQSAM